MISGKGFPHMGNHFLEISSVDIEGFNDFNELGEKLGLAYALQLVPTGSQVRRYPRIWLGS